MRRLRREMGWASGEQELSQISNDTLDIVVRKLVSLSRNSGERMVLGLSEDEVSSFIASSRRSVSQGAVQKAVFCAAPY